MERINKVWQEQIGRNVVDGISLEINLARRLGDNVIGYELPGEKFNEILADLSLLKIWTQWRSSFSQKYYLKDMTMVQGESGELSVSLNRTIHQEYLRLDHETGATIAATSLVVPLSRFPSNKEIFVHNEVLAQPPTSPDTTSSLHIKCVRKIPLGFNAFPPSDEYHAIERLAFRFYDHKDFTVYFVISRPSECSKKFEELLVNWQGSRFSVKIIVKNPVSEDLEGLLAYLGWSAE